MLEPEKNKKNIFFIGLIIFGAVGAVFIGLVAAVIFFLTGDEDVFNNSKDRIAIISIEGVISDSSEVVRQIKKYGEDPRVKGIILRIDSPGGGVAASQEIYQEVERIKEKEKKKIVTSMGSLAASGGYYIACASDRIMANPGTITGSIGVIMTFANLEKLLQKVGIDTDVIKSGKHKDMGMPTRSLTEDDKEILQGVIDDVYDQFVSVVSTQRKIDISKVRGYADGRIFSGRQAKTIGLVDELGSFQDSINYLSTLVGISGKPTIVQEKKGKSFFWKLLNEKFSGFNVSNTGLQYLWAY